MRQYQEELKGIEIVPGSPCSCMENDKLLARKIQLTVEKHLKSYSFI